MPFVKIEKSSTGARAASNEIRIGSRMQSRTVAKRSIYFAISRDLVKDVGWSITSNSDDRITIQVAVNEGTKDEAGFLLLSEDRSKGYVLGTNKGAVTNYSLAGSVTITRFKHYVLNDVSRDIEPESVEFTVDKSDKTILIQCPDWLRYNPLSVPNEPSLKEVVAPVAKTTFPIGTQTEKIVAALDELMDAAPHAMDTFNRNERRTLAKKLQKGLRR